MAFDNASVVAALKNVSVRRGNKLLLSEINFQALEGERWVVLGPNGAGKSTFINLLSTRLYPSEGRVEILQEELGRVNVFDIRPLIGLASFDLAQSIPGDETALNVVLTAAYAVVGRWIENYEAEDRIRAEKLLNAFSVGQLAQRRFHTLSTGEQKRVLSARALMTDPELLLLDEPGSGLDLGGREDLIRSLSRLAKDPKTPVTVLVTHHLEEIPPGFTHALLLREGAVVAQGPIDQVINSQNITKTFGLPLVVDYSDERFSARAIQLH